MIKIAHIAARLIEQMPFIAEALQAGLINISALAREIQPEVSRRAGRPVQAGAIVMAIQRMPAVGLVQSERSLAHFFRSLQDMSVRSDLLDYTFQNSETLSVRQAQLLAQIGRRPKVFYSVSRGIAETTLLIARTFEAEVDELFSGEKLLSKEGNLNAITLMLPAENRQIFGIYYHILRQLAWQGINVVEVVSTSNEFTIVVGDEDLEQAFAVLAQLRQA